MFLQVSVGHSVHRGGVAIPGLLSFLRWVGISGTRSLPLGWVCPGGGGYVQGVGMFKGVGTPPPDMRP